MKNMIKKALIVLALSLMGCGNRVPDRMPDYACGTDGNGHVVELWICHEEGDKERVFRHDEGGFSVFSPVEYSECGVPLPLEYELDDCSSEQADCIYGNYEDSPCGGIPGESRE